MPEEFRLWLVEEIKRRFSHQGAFAEKIGVSHAYTSRILSGSKSPSVDFLVKAAVALDISPVLVLTRAGVLPPTSLDDDPALQEIIELARTLTPEQRQEVIQYIFFLRQKIK